MLNNIYKRGFSITILIFTILFLYSKENNAIIDKEELSKEFDLSKCEEIDLLDYISIESGMGYIYKNITGAMTSYMELFMFSSMGKVIYSVYENKNQWKIHKEEYFYKQPYDTENQTLLETNFFIDSDEVVYSVSSQGKGKVEEKVSRSIFKIRELVEEIKVDLE